MTRPSKREVERAVDRLDDDAGDEPHFPAPLFVTPAGEPIATDAHDASRGAPLFILPPEVTDRWSGDVTGADRLEGDV